MSEAIWQLPMTPRFRSVMRDPFASSSSMTPMMMCGRTRSSVRQRAEPRVHRLDVRQRPARQRTRLPRALADVDGVSAQFVHHRETGLVGDLVADEYRKP